MLFPHSQSSLLQKRRLHTRRSLFKCDFCPRKFSKQNLIIPHSIINHSEEVSKLWISCSICKQYFPDEKQVERHKTLNHKEAGRVFHCNICKEYFPDKKQLERHKTLKHKKVEKVFHCDICNNSLASKLTFIEHVRRKHPEIVEKSWFNCNICSRKFPNENGLRMHGISVHKQQPCNSKSLNKTDLQKVHPVYDKCSFCPATFTKYDNFLEHNRANHEDIIVKDWFPCNSCNTFHPNKTVLSRHIASVHRKVGKIFCTFCPKTFTKRQTFLKHNRLNHADIVEKDWFQCATCNKLYPNQADLRRHIAIVHRKGGIQILCKFCPKHFGSEQYYNVHIRKKHSELAGKKFIECSICQNKFWSKHGLDMHTLTIHPTASLAQDEFRSTEMTNQQNESTIENKETTKITKLSLSAKRIISKCDFCPKAFEGITRLRDHNQQYHLKIIQDFWFRCDFCKELRPSRNSLFRHFQTAHKTIINNNNDINNNNNNNNNSSNNGCNFCPKSLTSKQHNLEHMRENHPESFSSKWLECSACKNIFRTKGGLNRHTTKVHTSTKVQNKLSVNEDCEPGLQSVLNFDKQQNELEVISTETSLQASEKSIDSSSFSDDNNDALDSSLSKKSKISGKPIII
jgi:uncharacterized short protein YbdD (DUF466 family)/stress-induced morphogen